MNLFPTSNEFATLLAEVLVKGALLLAVALVLSMVLRRASAAVRHGIWSLAFAGLLLLPAGVAFLPSLEVPMGAAPPMTFAASLSEEANAPAWVDPTDSGAIKMGGVNEEAISTRNEPPPTGAESLGTSLRSFGAWMWSNALFVLWAAGAAALLARLALVLLGLSYTTRRAEAVTDQGWIDLSERVAAELGVDRDVRLLRHERVRVPMTYGIRRPVILLPADAEAWADEDKYVTLLHEMLHVKRFDYPVHLAAQVARALHWFNPLAWVAAKQLLVERERACDDGVLSMGVASTRYADHLLSIARSVLTGQEASPAALAMARPSELRRRIVAILDPRIRRRSLTSLRTSAMAVCALVLILPLAAMKPGSAGQGEPAVRNFNAHNAQGAPVTEPVSADDQQDVATVWHEPQEPEVPEATPSEDEMEASVAVLEFEQAEEAEDEPAEPQDTSRVDFQKKAIFALSQLPDEESIPHLLDIARTHQNPEIRKEAIFWLGQKGGEQVREALGQFARNDPNPAIQKQAIFALSQQPDHEGVTNLIDIAKAHPDEEMRGEAIFWLGQSGDPRAARVLLDIVQGQ